MDIHRLHPNHIKTPSGGGFYPRRHIINKGIGKFPVLEKPDLSNNASTTLIIPEIMLLPGQPPPQQRHAQSQHLKLRHHQLDLRSQQLEQQQHKQQQQQLSPYTQQTHRHLQQHHHHQQPNTSNLSPPQKHSQSHSSSSFDDLSMNSNQIQNLLYGGGRHYSTSTAKHSPTIKLKYDEIHPSSAAAALSSSSSLVMGLPLDHHRLALEGSSFEMLVPSASSSFELPVVSGYQRDPRDPATRPETKDADTQTKTEEMLREYLPEIKDHKAWRMEKLDPFVEEVRKELIKNKPVNMPGFVLAMCEAKLEGRAYPETHRGHSGGNQNKTGMGTSLIKVAGMRSEDRHNSMNRIPSLDQPTDEEEDSRLAQDSNSPL